LSSFSNQTADSRGQRCQRDRSGRNVAWAGAAERSALFGDAVSTGEGRRPPGRQPALTSAWTVARSSSL